MLFLDGTWNKRESTTNVFHLHNLVTEAGKDGRPQLRYYHEGVGTGLLDYATGGAFGFGLNQNVIDAYNWIIENYLDGDEVYLFGFSRGAFTVRSLIGLIMKCGLLEPGAPLTVEQLWAGYQVLGRYREPDTGLERPLNLWERLVGRQPLQFRSLIDLKWDSSYLRKDKIQDEPLNGTERFLVKWSRRIKIHFVGVFDTVGAMGLDALAIPGLRTKIAAFHNTNPSRLMTHGLHALAIDEHRANFKHIPWQSFVHTEALSDTRPPKAWPGIEQRWFVGAHANVGGGYEDNPLGQFPLIWMLEKLDELNVGLRKIPKRPNVKEMDAIRYSRGGSKTALRDSRAEFLNGLGRLHAPYFRPMSPPPLVAGKFRIESINETIDPSVDELRSANSDYTPANYEDYLRRLGAHQ